MSASLKHLQTLINFSDSDLSANRQGRLSRTQIEALIKEAEQDFRAVLIIPFLLAVGIFTMLNFWLSLPAIFVLGAMMVGIYGFHQQYLERIKDRKVRKISGQLSKVPRSSSITHFAISLDGESFPVDREFYYQIPEGAYTVYLLDEGHQILGIEPGTKRASSTRKTTSASRPVAKSKAASPAKAAKPKATVTTSAQSSTKRAKTSTTSRNSARTR